MHFVRFCSKPDMVNASANADHCRHGLFRRLERGI
jgi:hypothetical protein